jgi:hypothetical protein
MAKNPSTTDRASSAWFSPFHSWPRMPMRTFIILFALIVSGCTRSAAPLESPHEQQATLSQQKMCADQADKSFNESSFAAQSPGGLGNTYTNHYDPSANVCYIEVTQRYMSGENLLYGLLVYDAFEGRVYGEFTSFSKDSKPMECSIKPRDRDEIVCASQEEFDKLALHYFGTTPD